MAQPAGAGFAQSQELLSKVRPVAMLIPQVVSGNGTVVDQSTATDLQGYESALIEVAVGDTSETLSGSLYATVTITDGATSAAADACTIADFIDYGGNLVALNATTGALKLEDSTKDSFVFTFAYIGGKRYIKAHVTLTGNHAAGGTPFAITCVKGHPRVMPATM